LQSKIVSSGLLEIGEVDPVTTAEMKKIEEEGVRIGVSKTSMMENAGSQIARFIFENSKYFARENGSKLRVLFVAGTGNNGGDAFVAARHLAYWKEEFDLTLVLVGNEADIKASEAGTNFRILAKIPSIKLGQVSSEADVGSVIKLLNETEVVVIGIFGTGFRGDPRSLQRTIIESINNTLDAKKISIDIPSGLEADTGSSKLAVRSDFTITMHAPKVGLLTNEKARDLCGKILIANIGVPR
jgi:hydroxyethylthiazole kinase-like uncharacterized protein yjeF